MLWQSLVLAVLVFAADTHATNCSLAHGSCANSAKVLLQTGRAVQAQARFDNSRIQSWRRTVLLATGTGGGGPDEAEAASQDAGSLPAFDLMIVVPSHGRRDVEQRDAIRDSWIQYMNETVNCTICLSRSVKVLFVVGKEGAQKKMKAEADEHDDLGILEDFGEHQARACLDCDAEKTQRSIRYALEHYKFKLLLKVDIDSYVFVDRLITFLNDKKLFDINATLPGVYAGNFHEEPEPVQHHVTDFIYPVYAKGAGYLLSPDLCEYIAGMGAATEDTSGAPQWGEEYGWAPVPRLTILPKEDISVGFWLAPVNHTKVPMPVSAHNFACSPGEHHEVVVDRFVSPEQMHQRWQSYLDTGDPCIAGRLKELSGEASSPVQPTKHVEDGAQQPTRHRL